MRHFLFRSFACLVLLFFFAKIVTAQNEKIKVACLGNSITAGYLLKDVLNTAYPAQLQKLLGAHYDVKNFGYSGATLLKNGHKPYYKTAEFQAALAFIPDIAIIHLGINDTDPRNWPNYKDQFDSDYSWLIDTLRKINPVVKVFICKLSPIFSGHPRFKSGTRDWYWQIQQHISLIAKANKTALIDLYEPLHNRPDLFKDNLHPDAEGDGIIAKAVYEKLTGNYGGLKMPSFFSDNMILQRQRPILFCGNANANTVVQIDFNHQHLKTVADEYGKWKIIFSEMQAGDPLEAVIKNERTVINFKNILIGDVWLCTGQSNMAFELREANQAGSAISYAVKNPNLRLLKYNQIAETNNESWDTATLSKVNKLQYFFGSWNLAVANSVNDFSAVAIFFANKIAADIHIPIGLIEVAVGGSPIESWLSRYTMQHDARLVDRLPDWRESDYFMPWVKERANVNLKNADNPRQRHPYDPAYIFEAAMDSLSYFPMKGVLWYQGESNAHNADDYRLLFTTMMEDWRKNGNTDLPFYFVQLSSIDRPSWPYFREMQAGLQKYPGVFMAVSSDVGDSTDVHPKNKKVVGERLALLAEKNSYHKNIVTNGPEFLSLKKEKENLVVKFVNAESLSTSDKKSLSGFQLVTDKGKFIPVHGEIRGDKVYLPISKNEKIVRIVYAWEPFTRANLVNKAGLPASTFSILINPNK